MTVEKRRRGLFFFAVALTLLHTQFFLPGALLVAPVLQPYRALLGVLEYLPAFLGMALLCFAFPWANGQKQTALRVLLFVGAVICAGEYIVVLQRGNSVLLWQQLINIACLTGSTAVLLAIADWANGQSEEGGPVKTRCRLLLGFQVLILVSHLSLLLTNHFFPPIDLVTLEPTSWYPVFRVGDALGGFAFWFRLPVVLLLLSSLFKCLKACD